MSIFTSKKVCKFLIKNQLTKIWSEKDKGWKVPSLMPIRVKGYYLKKIENKYIMAKHLHGTFSTILQLKLFVMCIFCKLVLLRKKWGIMEIFQRHSFYDLFLLLNFEFNSKKNRAAGTYASTYFGRLVLPFSSQVEHTRRWGLKIDHFYMKMAPGLSWESNDT